MTAEVPSPSAPEAPQPAPPDVPTPAPGGPETPDQPIEPERIPPETP